MRRPYLRAQPTALRKSGSSLHQLESRTEWKRVGRGRTLPADLSQERLALVDLDGPVGQRDPNPVESCCSNLGEVLLRLGKEAVKRRRGGEGKERDAR